MNNDQVQSMPSMDALCKNQYTVQEFLTYYRNTWSRHLAARCIDMQTDINLKAINPEELVQHEELGRIFEMPVKERLEKRKIIVQDALDLIKAIDQLLSLGAEDFETKALSKEALAVAEDMLPKEKAGDACVLPDGRKGTWQSDGKGGLTQVADAPEVAPAKADSGLKKYKVLKEWVVTEPASKFLGTHAVDSVVELDDVTAKPLVDDYTVTLLQ